MVDARRAEYFLSCTTMPAFSSHAEEISRTYKTINNNASLHLPLLRSEAAKDPFGFNDLAVATNFLLRFVP